MQFLAFGLSYQSAIAVARTSTTVPAFQTKVSLTTPVLRGTFRVGWCAVVDVESANRAVRARLRNATDGVTLNQIREVSPEFVTDLYPVGGFTEITLDGESKELRIEFSRRPGGGPPYTVGIQDANLEIWRVR